VLSGVARYRPEASASDILLAVNAVLYDNVRERMAQDEHVTFTLFRYERDGSISFAGAHEDVLVYRAREQRCEWIPTLGTWLGAARDIASATVESHMRLEEGDLMLLYTDGSIEARNAAGEMFGTERLEAKLLSLKDQSAQAICDGLLESVRAFAVAQDDDVTLLVARRL
jgi:sigma-B regulation protein RsbU (phosphoserine phosphatase)